MKLASSGGSAAAGGFQFETQIGAMMVAYMLAEHRLWPELAHAWPSAADWPTYVGLQTGHAVDDLAAYTQDMGLLVFQVKKGLKLSGAATSSLKDALQQAVQMFRTGRPTDTANQESTRSWNPITDRIVIATDAGAPRNVREDLAKIIARLATAPPEAGEDQLASNDGERNALQIFKGHVRKLWKDEVNSEITPKEFRAFCSVVRVMAFDLQPSGRDLANVQAILSNVLIDPKHIGATWTTLLSLCQELAAERRFITAKDLRTQLALNGIGIKAVDHGGDGIGPLLVPESVLHGPITSGPLKERISEADALAKSDPHSAAEQYGSVMAELRTGGYPHATMALQPRLTRALRASGQHAAAVRVAVAAAWSPLWLGEIPSKGSGAWILENELSKSPNEQARSGRAVVAILKYEAGQTSLADVAEQITMLEGADTQVTELVLWLAEEVTATQLTDLFLPVCDRALALAADVSEGEIELAGRLRIAVAESRWEWPALFATIEADYGAPMYVLAQARYGQALVWRNELEAAINCYEEAIKRGTEERMYAEVRTWLYDLRMLRSVFYGPGQQYDSHYTAQSLPSTHKVSVFAGEPRLLARGLSAISEGEYPHAHRIFMRLRHRMAAGAALIDQRECETQQGIILTAMDRPGPAVNHYVHAGNHTRAAELLRQQPDAPLFPDQAWLDGPVWQRQAVYELLSEHGDLVPESEARMLFNNLAGRLLTTGNIQGWSNFQANYTLLKPLAALAWASSFDTARGLLQQLAPLAKGGAFRQVVEAHVELVLECARMHPDLVLSAARQFVDLLISSDQAVPSSLEALQYLAPAHDYLSEQLLATFRCGKTPWLASVLLKLGIHHPSLVDYANRAVDRATTPREYKPNVMSFGSGAVDVATLSHVADADRRICFVNAMLDVALEKRESPAGRCEAIDAIAVVAQQCGTGFLGNDTVTTIQTAMRPYTAEQASAKIVASVDAPWIGSPATLMLAASRLLLILSNDNEERTRLVRTLLFTLMDEQVHEPRVLRSALAQAPAELFRDDLLVLAVSRTPMIRSLAAHYWAALPSTEYGIGKRLATDPARIVRQALAYALKEHERPDAHAIRTKLSQDCRSTIRTIIKTDSDQTDQ